ncbi:MAG TPA: hypothetical protein VGF69_03965 [Thermoanaerobaculia bacterium]|jgi:hypothetical protein
MFEHQLLRLPILLLLGGCATAPQTIPTAWLSVPEVPPLRSVQLADDGTVKTSDVVERPTVMGPVRIEENRLVTGMTPLTETMPFDSYDVSLSRQEVAFSAKRNSFDVGLVNLAGGTTVWVPADPADEVQVRWAPRGNKISYIVRGAAGDLVRTLHVPTSVQLTVDFPNARVHAVGWEPKAERYAALISSLDASYRVETVKYGGEDRKVAQEPQVRLDVVTELLAGGTLVRPATLKYDERLPLVIWLTDAPNQWDDALAALLTSTRVAALVTTKVPEAIDLPFVDQTRTYLVLPQGTDGTNSTDGTYGTNGMPGRRTTENGQRTTITADPRLPAGHYRSTSNIVTVPPAVVKSFAAGFIADQMKRTTPTNGSSR